jgi:phage shock protein E
MSDYDTRAVTYGFASKEDIVSTSALPTVVFLDVRTQEEIRVDGKLSPTAGGASSWVACSCTPDAAPELEANATTLLPDKDAPIIVYCKSGRRAAKAKEVLVAKGYKTVLNAGGFADLGYLNM